MLCLDVFIHITIETDKFGVETTWELNDSSGALIGSGGPYPGRYRFVEASVCSTDFGSHTFTMRDSFGDGMCCNAGNGGFKVYRDSELKIDGDGQFQDFIRYEVPAIGGGFVVENK